MFTFPNFLSFLRIPFGICFLYSDALFRLIFLILAGLTDFLDGFFARRYKQTSRFGTVLDPITDKFFVMSALAFFFYQRQIGIFEVCAMLCRDFSVILFGLYLIMTGHFSKYHFRSIWSGKISTALQLFVLVLLTLEVPISSYFYATFILLGLSALIELYLSDYFFIPAELLGKFKKNND